MKKKKWDCIAVQTLDHRTTQHDNEQKGRKKQSTPLEQSFANNDVAVCSNPCLATLASRACLCGFFRNGSGDGVIIIVIIIIKISSALVPLLTSGGHIAVDTAPSVNAATIRDGL